MEDKIIIKQINGQEIEYDILFSFIAENDNKKYIAYTNYEKDENHDLICYSALYENNMVHEIKNNEAVDIINNMLKTINTGAKIRYKINE